MSDPRDTDLPKGKSGFHPRRVLSYVLTALVVIFLLQNLTGVEVDFLLWTMRLPTAILVFFVFMVGIFVGFVMHQGSSRR